MKITVGLMLLAAAFLSQSCSSTRTIEQATLNQDDLDDDVDVLSSSHKGSDSGKTAFPYLRALGKPPAKVALVSFYVQSPAVKGAGSSTVLTAEGTKKIANNLLQKSLAPLKKNFKANGMVVLEPSEFLTDADKKSAFEEFEVKIEGGAAGMSAVFDMGDTGDLRNTGLIAGAAPADGYKFFDRIEKLSTYASVTNSIGSDLAKSLGVDAVLVVFNETAYDGDHAFLTGTNLYMFGPNPIPLKEEDLGGFTDGRKGHLYASVGTEKSMLKNVAITPPDADDLSGLGDEKNYRGFEKVVDALSKKMASYVNERCTEK